MPKVPDLIGKRFERLVVLERTEVWYDGRRRWKCQCDCGNTVFTGSKELRKGVTKSCGCYRNDIFRQSGFDRYRHGYGDKRNRTHKTWVAMRQRCNNPNDHKYEDYGGRSIYVCDRWEESFENFLEDMGEKPKGLSIDRIDNDGPYAPWNCRWATHSQQMSNTRRSIKNKRKNK